MPSWDLDSPQLRQNLQLLLSDIRDRAVARQSPSLNMALTWHAMLMLGLDVPNVQYVGRFRGDEGLERCNVRIGSRAGVRAEHVRQELEHFEQRLIEIVRILDASLPPGALPNADQLNAVVELCAWVHAEWVRIHPFANGNGRTARLWANFLAMRYGLPPFVRLRPRPDQPYGNAAASAMDGDWMPTFRVFISLLDEALKSV